jgi:hypothetical protein
MAFPCLGPPAKIFGNVSGVVREIRRVDAEALRKFHNRIAKGRFPSRTPKKNVDIKS